MRVGISRFEKKPLNFQPGPRVLQKRLEGGKANWTATNNCNADVLCHFLQVHRSATAPLSIYFPKLSKRKASVSYVYVNFGSTVGASTSTKSLAKRVAPNYQQVVVSPACTRSGQLGSSCAE